MENVINHVQSVLIQMKIIKKKLVKIVIRDVPSVLMKPILNVLNVMMVMSSSELLVFLVPNVNKTEDSIVIKKKTNVKNVITNVSTVTKMLMIVLNVSHQEKELQNVNVQMVTSITEIPVSDVTIDVQLVKIEILVLNVMITEDLNLLVNVLKDTMILVKKNVNYVKHNVLNVTEIMYVLNVLTQIKENHHLVIVLKDGKTLLMVASNVNKLHTQMVLMI